MTSFCECELCKKMRMKIQHPKCSYCGEYHDNRLSCPEYKKIIRKEEKKTNYRLEKYKNIAKKCMDKPILTATQTSKHSIDPNDCEYYLELENNKYTTYVKHDPYEFKALRYGEPWRDLCGDNLIFFLMVDLIEAGNKINKLEEELLKEEWEREI